MSIAVRSCKARAALPLQLPPRLIGLVSAAVWVLSVACSSSQSEAGRGDSAGRGGAGVGGSSAATAGTAGRAGLNTGGQAAVGGQLAAGGAMPAGASSGDEAGAAGSGDSPGCDAQHPLACPRGMYLSLWADHNGQNVFAGDTLRHLHILGDATKEAPVLDFIAAQRINSLSLYDLNPILSDVSRTLALGSFLEKARARGVREVLAICDTTQSVWDQIATEQQQSQTFDGLVTEIEFWTDDSFDTFQQTLTYVRALGLKSRRGDSLPIAAYVGWPTAEQTMAMAPLVDRLFVHAYVTSPDKALAYTKQRLLDLAAANTAAATPVEVRPIFSAEGATWSAGTEHFMGDWLSQHSLPEAEAQLLNAWSSEPARSLPPFGGFQYFEYFYLERYLR